MDAAALDSGIPCGFGVLKPNPVPALEGAVTAEVTESDWEKPLPVSIGGHSGATNRLAMGFARLRQCLDEDGNAALLGCYGH
jgi:hypothetical protein